MDLLRRGLQGTLVLPGSSGYDERRAVWNGTIDRRPAVIVCARTSADVVLAVQFARDHDLPLAVSAGGHDVAGLAVNDDGLVIDLREMTSVRIEHAPRLAHVQPGVRWGQFDREAQMFGLATTGGVDSRMGVAGLTLAGGNGYLARAHGLAADNLVAADVVTADGRIVRASEDEHPELFWALRGGGGNVGVVTSFVFRLHAVGPQVATIQAFYRIEDAPQVLAQYAAAMDDAAEAVSVYAMLAKVPPVDGFPVELHGRPVVAVAGMYAGSATEADRYLQPFTRLGTDPIGAVTAPMSYVDFQSRFDAVMPNGARCHHRSQFLSSLSAEVIATLRDQAGDLPGEFTIVGIEPMGGATGRLPRDATAFAHRDAAFNLGIWAGWSREADDEAMRTWARDLHDAMRPHGTGGVDANHLARLAAAKREWDPTNLFRGSHNVTPATPGVGQQGDAR